MEYGAVLRAQVHAEALGLNPLENGEEGVSQLPKSGWSCWERKKREKGKKQALSSRGYKKRFPLDHTFLPFVVSQKIHTFPFKVAKSMFFPFYREKKFLKTASLGAKIFSNFFFLWTFLKGEEVQGGKKGGCKEVPIRRVPI